MSMVFHGIGTMRYGERDYWPDGSFVTTEWFVIAFVPIFPTFSKRIVYTTRVHFTAYGAGRGYLVHETLDLDRRQVAFVYGWFVGLISNFVVWEKIEGYLTIWNREWVAACFTGVFAIWCSLPYFLRLIVKRRNLRKWRRQALGLGE